MNCETTAKRIPVFLLDGESSDAILTAIKAYAVAEGKRNPEDTALKILALAGNDGFDSPLYAVGHLRAVLMLLDNFDSRRASRVKWSSVEFERTGKAVCYIELPDGFPVDTASEEEARSVIREVVSDEVYQYIPEDSGLAAYITEVDEAKLRDCDERSDGK